MKQAFLILAFLSTSLILYAQEKIIQTTTLNFDSDQYQLTQDHQSTLSKLFEVLDKSIDSKLTVIGHTDTDGSVEYNLSLSERRARAAQSYLLELGYSANAIKIDHLGESEPLLSANGNELKSQSRRVSIISTTYQYESLNELISLVEDQQVTRVGYNPRTDTTVFLRLGTEAKIPNNAFSYLDGSPLDEGPVEINFKEAMNYQHMVSEQLFTQTADQMLETGGMIYIEALQNGKQLRLKEGKSIELLLPEQKIKKGMELFTAAPNEDGDIIWEETGQTITSQKKRDPIQVDLSPIIDFDFEIIDSFELDMSPLPPYPKPLMKPHPPAESKYLGDAYTEAYDLYEQELERYKDDLHERPHKLQIWESAVYNREKQLEQHRKRFYRNKVQKRLQYYVHKLIEQKDEVSHNILVSSLRKKMRQKAGDISYLSKYYRKKVFNESLFDVAKYSTYKHTDFAKIEIEDLFPYFDHAVDRVEEMIFVKHVEQDKADYKNIGRYVMNTTELGWINCDIFFPLQEEIMDLEFADNALKPKYYLVFKEIKSLLKPKIKDGQVHFDNIPKGKEVRLVSIGVKNEEYLMAYQDLTLGKDEEVNLNYQKAQISRIQDILGNI